MLQEIINLIFCSYCRRELTNEEEILMECHKSCKDEIYNYNTNPEFHPELIDVRDQDAKAVLALNSLFFDSSLSSINIPNTLTKIKYMNKHVFSLILDFAFFDDYTEQNSNRLNSILSDFANLSNITINRSKDEKFIINVLNINHKFIFTLNLSHNNLKNVPYPISKYQNLIAMNASNNQIKKIPEFVTEFKKLSVIDFSNNIITDIPPEISLLPKLKILKVNNNKLKSFPDLSNPSSSIYNLDLSFNEIKTMPSKLDLNSLDILNLSNNNIKDFPNIMSTNSLHNLDLSNNNISSIPESISSLESLKLLIISKNKLTSLKNIPSSLKMLDISDNSLKSLNSDDVDTFRNLDYLDLSNNNISKFPASIISLPIKVIRLSNNPISKNKVLRMLPNVII